MSRPERNIRRGAEQERNARLRTLENGPWEGKAIRAWSEVALARLPKGVDVAQSASVDLARLFDSYEPARQKELCKVLAPHWKKRIKAQYVPTRDSLDEALSLFQLYELAIETGYISLDDVKEGAREKLARLLWSEGARKYVRAYDYIAVGFLAARLGLEIGYGRVKPPKAGKKNNEGKFAQFVSQHRAWYEADVDAWLGLLDDYWMLSSRESDKDIFYKFLRNKTTRFDNEEILWSYVSGADRFLTLLTDLYATLTVSERPRYGLLYAYWMARFFGWDSKKNGFFRDRHQTDWSVALLTSSRLQEHFNQLESESRDMRAKENQGRQLGMWVQYRRTLEQRISNARQFWDTTRAFLEGHAR